MQGHKKLTLAVNLDVLHSQWEIWGDNLVLRKRRLFQQRKVSLSCNHPYVIHCRLNLKRLTIPPDFYLYLESIDFFQIWIKSNPKHNITHHYFINNFSILSCFSYRAKEKMHNKCIINRSLYFLQRVYISLAELARFSDLLIIIYIWREGWRVYHQTIKVFLPFMSLPVAES